MRSRGLFLILALALIAAACGSSGDDGQDAAEPSTTAAPTTAAPTTAAPTTAAPTTAAPTTTTEAPGPCEGGGLGSGSVASVITSGGNDYEYSLFVPSGYDGAAIPLVMEFHGLGSSGAGQSSLSAYQALAIREGFAVVSPTGIPGADDDRNSWELPQLDQPDRDDVQMVRELIDEISAQLCVDQSRIYATGMSNGGYFSAVLACELSDRIAATFSVAAVTHPDGCEPARPIAVGAVHGTADEVVPFDGGGESSLLTGDLEGEEAEGIRDFFSQVMPEEAAEFALDFDCATVTAEEIGPDTTLTLYADCDDGVEVRFYAVENGGHTWPGSPLAQAYAEVLGYATLDVNATEDGWAFMSRFSLPG